MRLGSLGGLIGASVNEFSTDGTLSQNSDTKVPTQQAVKTYVDGLEGVSGNFTVGGNLTVTGTTTTVSTANTVISDKLIELANGTTGSPSGDAGLIIERGSGSNVFIGWDESEDKVRFGLGAFVGTDGGDLTFNDADVQFGNISASRITTNEVIEKCDVSGGTLNGSSNLNLASNAVIYYTANAGGNWVWNLRADASTALNDIMANGDSMTFAALVTNGGTAYYNTGIQIDGTSINDVKWSGGTPPGAGNADSVDVYTFTVIKTSNATFSVFGSQSQFA